MTGTDNPLLGTWHLVRWAIQYGDGRPDSLPYGADATGLICYTHDGSMSTCIGAAARPRLSSPSVRSAPVPERLAAFESFFQYAGRYRIEPKGDGQRVVHSVTHALNPNFVGTEQIRDIDLSVPGCLTLSASDLLPGTQIARHHRLQWQRRPAP